MTEESRLVTGAATASDSELVVDLRDEAAQLIDTAGVAPHHVPFVDLGLEYRRSKGELDAAIAGVLDRGDFVLGSAVSEFEAAFASYCGVEHAIGVDSGYSALEMSLRGLGIGPGDEVITAANTFVATAAAIEATGAAARLVDIDPKTRNMNADKLEAAITDKTKAVIPVHLYGQPADMENIGAIAGSNGLRVVEDACQAHGALYRGRRAGSLGDAGAFSFYPSKNLGAFGDGGMIVTDDGDLADRIRLLRNVGSRQKYHHEIKGFNRRLDTIHAAVLTVKLSNLDEHNASRAATARIYDDLLADLPITTPWVSPDGTHVYHLYVIETDDRDGLLAHLGECGVSAGIHYPVPIHLQRGYGDLGYGPGDFPHTEELSERILSLPIYPNMPLESIAHVAASVRAFFDESE